MCIHIYVYVYSLALVLSTSPVHRQDQRILDFTVSNARDVFMRFHRLEGPEPRRSQGVPPTPCQGSEPRVMSRDRVRLRSLLHCA